MFLAHCFLFPGAGARPKLDFFGWLGNGGFYYREECRKANDSEAELEGSDHESMKTRAEGRVKNGTACGSRSAADRNLKDLTAERKTRILNREIRGIHERGQGSGDSLKVSEEKSSRK